MTFVTYLASKTNGGKREVLNTMVTASMLTMPSLPELPQQQNIVGMLGVTIVFQTSDFPPCVLLTRLCHESHLIPLLDFQLGSYKPHQKFSTYFVGGFCSNLECILSHVNIGNVQYISEIHKICVGFLVPT